MPSSSTVLKFSFIGYVTQEITVNNQRVIDLTLAEESQLLDEVVVVGYGTTKKESLTSAISVIKSEEIVATKQVDVMATLQGKIPRFTKYLKSQACLEHSIMKFPFEDMETP